MAETKKPAKRQRPGAPVGGAAITPEGRQRLSERMKERQRNGEIDPVAAGKLGGRGNTKEKRRAAQSLAEHLRSDEMLEKMRKTLEDGLDEEQAIGTRLKTLEIATKIENDDAKLNLQEESAAGQQRSREELLAALRQGLSKGRVQQLLAQQAQIEQESIVDAEVVEDDE